MNTGFPEPFLLSTGCFLIMNKFLEGTCKPSGGCAPEELYVNMIHLFNSWSYSTVRTILDNFFVCEIAQHCQWGGWLPLHQRDVRSMLSYL